MVFMPRKNKGRLYPYISNWTSVSLYLERKIKMDNHLFVTRFSCFLSFLGAVSSTLQLVNLFGR